MMESAQPRKKDLSGSNIMMNSTESGQSQSDYEDDFEQLDALKLEKSSPSADKGSKSKSYLKKAEGHSDADTAVEKGQRESSGQVPMEKDKVKEKPGSGPTYEDLQSDDSEPEAEGEVMFTEGQHRAMMELMAQKHSTGDYTGDPPEYNVKERLKELNEELAKEPDPDDRQHRVGFKKELVDLVAPPPEVSDDDDDSPRKILQDGQKSTADEESRDTNKKQFVVERDGKFDIVDDQELSAEERAMFDVPDDDASAMAHGSKNVSGAGVNQTSKNNSSSAFSKSENVTPQPPSKPRPNTANGYARRNGNRMQSPRPRTASSQGGSSNAPHYGSALQDFNYSSPYAMSSTEKERAQERARLREQQKKEEERYRQEEEEYRRQESEDAFRAWLQQKMEEDKRKRHDEGDRMRTNGRDDKMDSFEKKQHEQGDSTLSVPSSESFEAKESEEAFRGWLKQKQAQLRREKLLKKREEQGVKDTYYVRSREECDSAFKEWMKRKYAEFRKQRVAEKERQKSFISMARRARKQQMIARAVRQSPAFRYNDIYGYRL